MLSNQEELYRNIDICPIIAIIDPREDKNSPAYQITQITDNIYENRVKFVFYKSSKELPPRGNQNPQSHKHGLINLKWINTITTYRPSVILYNYPVAKNAQPREVEEMLFKEIKELKEMDQFLIIELFVYRENSAFTFETEERDRPYNLNKLIDRRNLKIINTNDSWRETELKKYRLSVIKLAKEYYKNLKKNVKKKMEKDTAHIEEKIKFSIKNAILTLIKTKKKKEVKTKHLDNAYNLLKKVDRKKYFYGSENTKINYCELKAAADWVFFKYMALASGRLSIKELTIRFNDHLCNFSTFAYFDKEKDKDYIFYELYWLYKRYDYFISKMLEKQGDLETIKENCLGFFILKEIYVIKKILRLLVEYDHLKLNIVEKGEFKDKLIEKVNTQYAKYYEKIPIFSTKIDPLIEKAIEFSEEIFFKKFILENKISNEELHRYIVDTLHKKCLLYFDKFARDNKNFNGLNLYLLIINLMNEIPTKDEMHFIDLKNIFIQITKNSKGTVKFPKLYFHFVSKFNDVLIEKFLDNQQNCYPPERLTIFRNLVTIGNYRTLTNKEEEVFFKILRANNFLPSTSEKETPTEKTSEKQEYVYINYIDGEFQQNKIFNFEYKIYKENKQDKKVLELIQFDFSLSTLLTKDKFKFASIELFFDNDKRVKKFTSFPNELSKDTPINLNYKFFMKENQKLIRLKRVQFVLESNPGLLFDIEIPSDGKKIIIPKDILKKVLKFKTPNILKLGESQLYVCECEVSKDSDFDVQVGELSIAFKSQEKPLISSSSTLMAQSQIMKPMNKDTKMFQTKYSKSKPQMSTTISSILNAASPSMSVTEKPQQPQNKTPLDNQKENVLGEFYIKDEKGNISQPQNQCSFKYDNFEDNFANNTNKIQFLVKFKSRGKYNIQFQANYKILNKEIEDDAIELSDNGIIEVEVNIPFFPQSEIIDSIFLKSGNQKIYGVGKTIRYNLVLENKLDTNAIIKDIEIIKEECNVEITSVINNIINLDNPIKHSLLTILKSSDYSIPFNLLFNQGFTGSFGKVNVKWTTDRLQEFSPDAENVNTFVFPEISTQILSTDLSYEIGEVSKDCNCFEMKIIIENKQDIIKKIFFIIDTSFQFYINGFIKENLMLYPNEKKILTLRLTPFYIGQIRLPPFKISEIQVTSGDKLNSLYCFPDYIQLGSN